MHSSNAVVTKLRPLSTSFIPPSFLLPYHKSTGARRHATNPFDFYSAVPAVQTERLRTLFAGALAGAGSCCHHRPRSGRPFISRQIRHKTDVVLDDRREKASVKTPKENGVQEYTEEQYLSLLDFYKDYSNREKSCEEDNKPGLLSWSEGSVPSGSFEDDYDDYMLDDTLDRLDMLLGKDSSTPEEVFDVYKRLPEPGVRFLSKEQRIYLIRSLSVMEHKTSARTLAYLSVLDDYKKAGLPIPRHAWNSAMSLGSTTLPQITDVEVEFALRTWKEMELDAGVRGSDVTFNILFDIASKAGKFSLAEMILKEMDVRKLEYTRFTHVGLILYHGLRRDGDQVRNAYRDLVTAKEIVDTTVLNCVISALMAAGEPEAADAVFKRMKTMSLERGYKAYVPKPWSERHELGRILKWIARQAREERKRADASGGDGDGCAGPKQKLFEDTQDTISIAPDTRTCNILMRHYCGAGQLQRAVGVLEEMQEMRIPHNEKLFRDLFMGFATHGGVKYSAWTSGRLDNVWQAFKRMLKTGDVSIGDESTLLVIWAIVAARRCLSPREAIHVFHDLRQAWQGKQNFDEVFRRPPGDADEDYDIPIPEDLTEIVTDSADIEYFDTPRKDSE